MRTNGRAGGRRAWPWPQGSHPHPPRCPWRCRLPVAMQACPWRVRLPGRHELARFLVPARLDRHPGLSSSFPAIATERPAKARRQACFQTLPIRPGEHCSPPRASQRLELSLTTGRISGGHDWPLLGGRRGPHRADPLRRGLVDLRPRCALSSWSSRSSRSTRFSKAWHPGQAGLGAASLITSIHRSTRAFPATILPTEPLPHAARRIALPLNLASTDP